MAIVVLGIGNLLWADEGFGVRCVDALAAQWQFAPGVQLVDGGTQGLYLLPQVQQASHLLIFDAIDYGLAPGSLHLVEDEEVPRFLGARKMSLHQTGFQEVLALARLTDSWPRHVLLVGCQPAELEDFGGSLSPAVKAALAPALQAAVTRLRAWGADPQPRAELARGEAGGVAGHAAEDAAHGPDAQASLQARADAAALTAPVLALATYESGRPPAEAACRIGDARFLPPVLAAGTAA